MRKIIIALLFAALPALSVAAEGNLHLDDAHVNLSDKASLQRGARLFVNYCLSCHSAAYMRYNRMAKDIGLTDKEVKNNMLFASDKVGDTMTVAMTSAEAAKWFGKAPPDLTVRARARGADWIYTYLRSFYLDPKKPTGVNNTVFKDVGMPDVLWELEGLKAPVYKTVENAEGDKEKVIDGFEMVKKGKMTQAQFDGAMHDLTNFLVYMAEPARLQRVGMGIGVEIFLAFFFIVAYMLKKEYWKDVH